MLEEPPADATPAAPRSNKDLLTDFYAQHDAAKVPKVDDILAGWPLQELLEALKKKYGECPDLAISKPKPAVPDAGGDAGVISSDNSDLAMVSCNIVKKKKKDKKEKKEKKKNKEKKQQMPGMAQAINTNGSGLQVLKVNRAATKTPKNWGTQWWAQANLEVNDIKKKLTKKAMHFVDEAVRKSIEERQRQATERREARHLGLKKEEACTLLIDSDVEPEPVAAEEYADPYADTGDFDPNDPRLDQDNGFRADSGDEDSGGEDDPNRTAKKKRRTESIRKPSQKEQMTEALAAHMASLENNEEGGGAEGATDAAAVDFKEFDTYDAQKAHDIAHGIAKDGEESSGGSGSDSSDSSDDEKAKKKNNTPASYWRKPPEDLLERADLEDSLDGSRAYVAHWICYVMGIWAKHLQEGVKIEGNGLTDGIAASFNSNMVIEKTKDALTPLLSQLQRNTVQEGMLRQLDSVVTLAAKREYKTCMQEYVLVTMGRKTWHQTIMQTMMQQNHGGSVCKISKQSPFVDFDYDPAVNAYMLALKRVIQFLQWLRPPTEISMGSYM